MGRLTTSCYLVILVIIMGSSTSCFPDDYDRCGEGFEFKRNDCYKIESDPLFDDKPDDRPDDAGADADSIELDEWIGSPCSCDGELCRIAGVPTLFRGTIRGCDDVPKVWPGAVVACMETYTGELSLAGYYARGFCTLLAMDCVGGEIICNAIPRPESHNMTACPERTVMVTIDYSLSVSGLSAELSQKTCAPVCERDEDCRTDDFDEKTDSRGQYECIRDDGISFCHDARNLANGFTAEAF